MIFWATRLLDLKLHSTSIGWSGALGTIPVKDKSHGLPLLVRTQLRGDLFLWGNKKIQPDRIKLRLFYGLEKSGGYEKTRKDQVPGRKEP